MLLPIVKIAKCFRHVVSLNVNILFITPTVPVDAQDICRSKSGIHHRPVSAGFSHRVMFAIVQQLLSSCSESKTKDQCPSVFHC